MLTGYLRSKHLRVSESYVGKALCKVNPNAQHKRSVNSGRSLNPRVYKADYFGNKLHLDQNEKLAMYGVTHICARDGYSGLITAFLTLPVKNNVEIYEHVYR